MVRTKIDSRIKTFIENGVKLQHRTMFVVVGDKGRDQVMILHHILSKSVVKARPSVLWCYKKELGFSSNKKKRMKQVQRKIKAGKVNINEEDPFELFIASTNIRYCYYSETQKILGQTFGVCVLQDFEALTPNLLARTIETVEGGGLIILLLRTINSLRQLYSMTMDVHERYRTEAHRDVVGRFNERFILSLSSCERCLVVDSNLNVLPISSHIFQVNTVSVKDISTETDDELKSYVDNLRDTQPVGSLIACCKTLDQAKAVLKFIDAISEKTLKYTVSLTAARGRGKSAALGLSVAGAVAFGYTNIFVTSPSPDNLKTFFEFVFKGFDVLGYQEHLDYGLVESTNSEYNKALIRVNIFKTNRQTIQYIHPTDCNKLSHAELLVIDEAAAIPLPFVKRMLGPYLVFLSSTINGYEGTGRSLSLKLLNELRTQSNNSSDLTKSASRTLYEITLEESIRYKPGDSVEEWLTNLLCLNASNVPHFSGGIPPPSECDLYYVNRDTLFSYHKASEIFLQKMVSLYVSSHYKNSPNDLQLLSDAPAHHIFCLLGPVDKNKKALPEILCVIQVCLEGQLTSGYVSDTFSTGRKPTGDLIPWTVGQQFLDKNFPTVSGVRIVRIATHPDYQSMGYGARALSLLIDYYNLEVASLNEANDMNGDSTESSSMKDDLLNETVEPRSNLPPLMMKINERTPERIQYIGVSYGLTSDLLRFWKRSGFIPIYLRQTPNELTGEHSCIMIKKLNKEDDSSWLQEYWTDFRRRFSSLLSYQFRELPTSLALSVLTNKNIQIYPSKLTKGILDAYLTLYDLKRLDRYCNNLVDYHLIMDLLPTISKLYFSDFFSNMKCTAIQSAILLGVGLQHKTVDDLSKELDLPSGQLMGIFNRTLRKIQEPLNTVMESAVEEALGLNNMSASQAENSLTNNREMMDLGEEMEADSRHLKKKQKKELDNLKEEYLKEFAIQGTDEEWNKALSGSHSSTISIKKATQVMKSGSNVFVEEPNLIPHKKKKKMKKF